MTTMGREQPITWPIGGWAWVASAHAVTQKIAQFVVAIYLKNFP